MTGPAPLPALLSRARAPWRTPAPRPAADAAGARGPDHDLLGAVIDSASDGWRVDYRRVGRSAELAAYGRQLGTTDPDALDRLGQVAFWINAYNACVLALVGARWPLASIVEIPGAFTNIRFAVGGRRMTLDDMEHGKARRLGEPLVHVGLNCGSVGCPPLRGYGGDVLAELEVNGRRYLADTARGARLDGDRLLVSRIFQWFGGDFAPLGAGPSAASTLAAVAKPARVLPALSPLLPPRLRTARSVGFLDYDWSVNGR